MTDRILDSSDVLEASGLGEWQVSGNPTYRSGPGPSRVPCLVSAIHNTGDEHKMEADITQKAVMRGSRSGGVSDRWWHESSVYYADTCGQVEAAEIRARRAEKAAGRPPLVEDKDTYNPKKYLVDPNMEVITKSQLEANGCSLLSGPDAAAMLLTACQGGDEQLLARLLRRRDSHDLLRYAEASTHKSALHLAAQRGHAGTCARLLEHSADVHAPDKHGRTALAIACMYARPHIVKQLMHSHAQPGSWDLMERSAMHLACCCSDPHVASLLLSMHPSLLDQQDGHGRTSLWYCLSSIHKRKRPQLMEDLLRHHANPNIPDCHGRAPLWYAARAGLAPLVGFLLDYRADPNVRDHANNTAFEVARGTVARAYLDPHFDDAYLTVAGAENDDSALKAQGETLQNDAALKDLQQVQVEMAKREQTIHGLRTRLQEMPALDVNVTGVWSCNEGRTLIMLRQDQETGEVVGEIATPGLPELVFEGRVVADELTYTTGSKGQPTTFTLYLVEDSQVLRGRWKDFRGGSGEFEMHATPSV